MRQGSGPLIALVQKMRHSVLDIEDHLAEHAIGPAKPVEIVSARLSVMKRQPIQGHTIVSTSLFRSKT